MKIWMLVATAAVAVTAGAASAQPYGRGGGSATLYELPGFQGRQITITGETTNLPRDFNDRARSARFQGRWEVCENADFGGRCQELSGDVPSLNDYGLAERISSLQPSGGRGGGRWDDDDDRDGGYGRPGGGYGRPGGDWGGGPRGGGRPVEGATAVFFAYPTIRGADIAAGSTSANEFCRRSGQGGAVYFDSSQRSGRAVDINGRPVGSSTVLRDLLCRKY